MKKKTWIIGISGSEMDDVVTYRVTGTEAAVKEHLAGLVKYDETENPEHFDYGDTKVSDVKELQKGKKFYAGATFSSYHNDYTATLEMDPLKI